MVNIDQAGCCDEFDSSYDSINCSEFTSTPKSNAPDEPSSGLEGSLSKVFRLITNIICVIMLGFDLGDDKDYSYYVIL